MIYYKIQWFLNNLFQCFLCVCVLTASTRCSGARAMFWDEGDGQVI